MPAFIVAENPTIAARVRDVLIFGGMECPLSHVVRPGEAGGRLSREQAIDLVIVVLPPDLEGGLALLPGLARIAPGKILAVGPAGDARVVLRALRTGASDFIEVGELESEIDAAIHRRVEALRAPVEAGKLIAVLSPSGGGGSSTVAANLATALAKEHKTVALLDLKLEAGDLGTLLDLRPTFTLADICRNVAKLDKDMFERSMVRHDSGVCLLAAPLEIRESALVRPDGIEQSLHLARAGWPFVVADVDHSYRDEQRSVLRQADLIVVVFRLEFASLRNARRALEQLEALEVPAEKICLVANRVGQPQEVASSKAEEALGHKVAHTIPEDARTVNRASNNGVPVVIEAPSSKVARSLTQLATLVASRCRT